MEWTGFYKTDRAFGRPVLERVLLEDHPLFTGKGNKYFD